MTPEDIWGSKQQKAASAEGWNVFECTGGRHLEIQTMDGEDSPFATDYDARKHVERQAHLDSPLHLRALLAVALRPVEDFPGDSK